MFSSVGDLLAVGKVRDSVAIKRHESFSGTALTWVLAAKFDSALVAHGVQGPVHHMPCINCAIERCVLKIAARSALLKAPDVKSELV